MRIVIILILLLVILCVVPTAPASADDNQRAVLITGASSGIGRVTAELLAESGYFVYAGARKQEDIDALNRIDNIMAIRLDVTKQDEVDTAVAVIREQGRGLWGLVNNAGINLVDPLVEVDLADVEFLFDVNVFGVMRVTKAFAPMIIESEGRIVNISSIAGILSGGITGYGMYSMTKHSIEAYTDHLAWELARFGVSVSAVEPGNFNSQIGVSRCERMVRVQADKKYTYFADDMAGYVDICHRILAGETNPAGPPPEPVPVATAVEHALFSDSPKEHYLVTGNSRETRFTIGKAIEEVAHLNLDHEHSLSLDDLVYILENELAVASGEQPRGMPGFYEEPEAKKGD